MGRSPSGYGLRFAVALLLLASSACAYPPGPAALGSQPAATARATTPGGVAGEITVLAASSLTDAFNEIAERFRAANPAATVIFNFAASTQLVTQLDQGARADAFASADPTQMARATSAGLIDGAGAIFARNRLVLIAPANNPGGISGPADLAKPGLKVVTSQPDVPIGVYTQSMLDRMSSDPRFGSGYKDRVNANVVSQEANVRQVVAKVLLGEADAGIVYRSDVTHRAAPGLVTFDVPDEFNTAASYPMAAVRAGSNPAGGAAFMAFVLSPVGQGILAKWNFVPVGPVAS